MRIEDRIKNLQSGISVKYRESGNSMRGIIEHRELITCAPIDDHSKIKSGDAVFCKVRGNYYTHLVKGVRSHTRADGTVTREFLIGNNRGGTNGWTSQEKVYGKVVRVDP